jgi:hypothetical protein
MLPLLMKNISLESDWSFRVMQLTKSNSPINASTLVFPEN